MARLKQQYQSDGFYGIGILNSAEEANIGTLWRTAYILGASFIFTIDRKYKKQSTDVTRAWTKIPLYHYPTFEQFSQHIPYSTQLIGVEMTPTAIPIENFTHPPRAIYLLGCESSGLPPDIIASCHQIVSLPGNFSLNVAVAGSLIAHDRIQHVQTHLPIRTDV